MEITGAILPRNSKRDLLSSCYTIYVSDESPVESIKLTVTMKDGCETSGLLHPIAISEAARILADRSDNDYAEYPSVFGPYVNKIDFGG